MTYTNCTHLWSKLWSFSKCIYCVVVPSNVCVFADNIPDLFLAVWKYMTHQCALQTVPLYERAPKPVLSVSLQPCSTNLSPSSPIFPTLTLEGRFCQWLCHSQQKDYIQTWALIVSLKALPFWYAFLTFIPGDPHQFEQKFNYRRPMYPILRYMWDTDNYRESIKVRICVEPAASDGPASCGSELTLVSLGLALTGLGWLCLQEFRSNEPPTFPSLS